VNEVIRDDNPFYILAKSLMKKDVLHINVKIWMKQEISRIHWKPSENLWIRLEIWIW